VLLSAVSKREYCQLPYYARNVEHCRATTVLRRDTAALRRDCRIVATKAAELLNENGGGLWLTSIIPKR